MADEVLIFNIEDRPIDLGEYMAGPWRETRFAVLEPGASLDIASSDIEYSAFVARGAGRLTLSSGETFDLYPGSALAFPRPGSGTIVAGEYGLEALVVAVAVTQC